MRVKVGCITTSRADFGIYLPLLEELKASSRFELYVFAGGMHTSEKFGNTYQLIEKHGFTVSGKFDPVPNVDKQSDVSEAMGRVAASFSSMLARHEPMDLFLLLGDRYEMFAAASVLVPLGGKLVHFHGGEVTLGAIDNKFRHALTMLADVHFCSNDDALSNVKRMVGKDVVAYNVGAMGLDNMLNVKMLSAEAFTEQFEFDIKSPFVLTTFHPETVDLNNAEKAEQVVLALKQIDKPVLCTLPNADTEGSIIRNILLEYEQEHPKKIKCVENLGQQGYLTAMKNCDVMLGNTSSGIIEAASFNKPVVNIGNRQLGRISGDNVIHCKSSKDDILKAYKTALSLMGSTYDNPYGDGKSAKRVMNILDDLKEKEYFNN